MQGPGSTARMSTHIGSASVSGMDSLSRWLFDNASGAALRRERATVPGKGRRVDPPPKLNYLPQTLRNGTEAANLRS